MSRWRGLAVAAGRTAQRPSSIVPGIAQTSDSGPDAESQGWVRALRSEGQAREETIARLHELLLRGARFEVGRRHREMPHLRGGDLDDIALQSADDALVAVLSKLDGYRGESRFTTWAYKFALLEAGVKMRRFNWQGRELPLEPQAWPLFFDGRPSPEQSAEAGELMRAIQAGVEEDLTPHQREVFVALALNTIPIDVLAERLGTTRGALYKTLHDARKKLRGRLAASGLEIEDLTEAQG